MFVNWNLYAFFILFCFQKVPKTCCRLTLAGDSATKPVPRDYELCNLEAITTNATNTFTELYSKVCNIYTRWPCVPLYVLHA